MFPTLLQLSKSMMGKQSFQLCTVVISYVEDISGYLVCDEEAISFLFHCEMISQENCFLYICFH